MVLRQMIKLMMIPILQTQTDGVDNKVDNNTVDPKASAIDEAVATDATNDGIVTR